jgi:hypothetical protein
MSFMLKSFLGGAAEGLTSKLNKDEKDAQELAKIQFATMYKTDQENKAKREELRNKLTSNAERVRSLFPQLTGDQLFETAKNPGVMDYLVQVSKERDFDPSKINPNDIVTIAGKATGLDYKDLIANAIDKSIVTAPAAKIPEGLGMFERRNRAIAEDAFNRQAAAMGVSPDVLRGASQYKVPELETKATFNLGVLAKPAGFDKRLDEAKSALVDALASKDDAKIQVANANATRFKLAEDLFRVDPKQTEADIQTALASKIVAANKNQDKKTATALTEELRMRQELMKRPGDDKEKVTQANYIVIATRAMTSAIENVLPPGSFVTTQSADGTTSLQPKDLASEKLFRQGQTAGRAAVVAEFTDPKTGLPKSDMHKNAMISIGIQFDQGGKPIVGAVTPTPTGTPTPAPSGSSAAPRAGTATPAAAPAPTGAKAVTGKIGEPAAPALAPAPAAAPAAARPPVAATKKITMADVNNFVADQNKKLPANKQVTAAQVIVDLKKNDYTIVD